MMVIRAISESIRHALVKSLADIRGLTIRIDNRDEHLYGIIRAKIYGRTRSTVICIIEFLHSHVNVLVIDNVLGSHPLNKQRYYSNPAFVVLVCEDVRAIITALYEKCWS